MPSKLAPTALPLLCPGRFGLCYHLFVVVLPPRPLQGPFYSPYFGALSSSFSDQTRLLVHQVQAPAPRANGPGPRRSREGDPAAAGLGPSPAPVAPSSETTVVRGEPSAGPDVTPLRCCRLRPGREAPAADPPAPRRGRVTVPWFEAAAVAGRQAACPRRRPARKEAVSTALLLLGPLSSSLPRTAAGRGV